MKFIWLSVLVVCSSIISGHVYALDTRISQSKFLNIELEDVNNKDEFKIIRVKDANSGKIAQVRLMSSSKDSGSYKGFFIIQFFAGDTTPRELEFFEPGENPYFIYASDSDSGQNIVLFNDAKKMENYTTKQLKDEPVSSHQVGTKPAPILTQKKMDEAVRTKARDQEKKQITLEEGMVKKRMALLEKEQKMSKAEKQKKVDAASAFVREADAAYAKQDYISAEELYGKAVEANPEEDSYYYRYGVSLYKVNKYNQSLATLSVAETPDKEIEKSYFIALNHLKLQDFVKAHKEMIEVRDENDPDMSPYAAYFAGTIEVQKKSFTSARKNMQYVLDNSKDPKLDLSADEMMDQIDQLERYYDSKKEKFRFSFFGGVLYDSNILNVASNNSATDVNGYRLNYGASALAIWFRTIVSDFGTQVVVSDYYSINSKMQGDANLQTTDPLVFALTLPYHYEWTMDKRPLRLEVQPLYSSTYMAPAGGTRKEIIRSMGGNTTLSFPMKSDFLLAGRLDVSSDKSSLDLSSTDDDQSGTKLGLTLTPTKILDLRGEKTLSADLSYLSNATNGSNYRSKRLGVGLIYAFPIFWRANGSVRLDYSSQNYAAASVPRTDKVTTATLSGIKDLSKNWNFLTSFQYSTSQSEVDIYRYDKYILTGLFTYTTSILGK